MTENRKHLRAQALKAYGKGPTTVATGQRWALKGSGVSWRVVSVSMTHIGLSGPGPLRSYQSVTVDDLEKEWVRLG